MKSTLLWIKPKRLLRLGRFYNKPKGSLYIENFTERLKETKGQIVKPLIVFDVPRTDPIWEGGDIYDNYKEERVNVPSENRYGFYFIVMGHRRQAAAMEILSKPDVYTKTVYDAVKRIPCNIYSGDFNELCKML